MANPLFPNFTRAQAEALENFRQTRLGRVVATAAEAIRRGRTTGDAARGIARDLGQRAQYARSAGTTGDFRSAAQRRAEGDLLGTLTAHLGARLGGIIGAMVRPQGTAVGNASIQAELAVAAALLESFGWQVTQPRADPAAERAPSERPEWMRPREAPRETEYEYRREHGGNVPFGSPTQGYPEDDPVMTGEMILVRSSNVHSIGYRWNRQEPSKGTLIVRFLEGSGDERTEAGPTYAYYDVHPGVFQAFRQAASKGKFVWDRLRLRGSVTGHQFAYKLIGVAKSGYVPRQAKRYGNTDYFVRRQVQGARTGQTYSSARPDQRVGPVGARRPGAASAYRGQRTEPNRGR